MTSITDEYHRVGTATFDGGLDARDLQRITAAFGASAEVGSGHRQSALGDELIAWLAGHARLAGIAAMLLGRRSRLTRVIAFDKSLAANWFVPWHQDRSIALKAEHPAEGFGHWTRKDGYVQAEPPVALLEAMATLRLHLDDCDAGNGPLEVIPGSHRQGRLDHAAIEALVELEPARACLARPGEIVTMSPLVVHRSRKATHPRRRRVLHLEYAGASLPAGLEWAIVA